MIPLMVDKSDIERFLSMTETLEAVERSFKLEATGRVIMPPKLYLNLPKYKGDFRAMPAYIDGCAGIKWVSVYPNNREHNLPTVVAIIILSDPGTGYPLAIMDGTHITNMRTGAAGGVAVKYLARKDSAIVGMVGAGTQAKTQLLAISEVLPGIQEVKVFDQYEVVSEQYAEQMRAKLGISVHAVNTIEKAAEADIVVTTTPSRSPIVKKQYIRPGTHINAIGADAKGKQELEGHLLTCAKVVVDDTEQAWHSGEINVPLSERLINTENIYGNLGEIINGIKKGREREDEITIFDSTGLAIQDIICAKLVYDHVKDNPRPNTLAFDCK